MSIAVKIKNLFKRVINQTMQLPKNIKNFGLKPAGYIWFDRVFLGIRKEKYITVIQAFMDKYLHDLVDEYNKKIIELPCNPSVNTVWCCWWTGEETAPEIIKMCINSIRVALPDGIKMIFINQDNYSQYVDIPEYIIKKYNEKKIGIAHLSDIIRFGLLSKYGGFWIDSTVFAADKIPEEYFASLYYTQRFGSKDDCPNEPCCGKWAGFLQCGVKENKLFSYMFSALKKYWRDYDYAIDYVMFDYMIMAAYKKIDIIKNMIDDVPINNTNLWEMQRLLSTAYVDNMDLASINLFNKLARTLEPPKTVDGKETVYGYLCKRYIKE